MPEAGRAWGGPSDRLGLHYSARRSRPLDIAGPGGQDGGAWVGGVLVPRDGATAAEKTRSSPRSATGQAVAEETVEHAPGECRLCGSPERCPGALRRALRPRAKKAALEWTTWAALLADLWRREIVPSTAFRKADSQSLEGVMDVQRGALRAGSPGLHGGGDVRSGSLPAVWPAPGHGAQDAGLVGPTWVQTPGPTPASQA